MTLRLPLVLFCLAALSLFSACLEENPAPHDVLGAPDAASVDR